MYIFSKYRDRKHQSYYVMNCPTNKRGQFLIDKMSDVKVNQFSLLKFVATIY